MSHDARLRRKSHLDQAIPQEATNLDFRSPLPLASGHRSFDRPPLQNHVWKKVFDARTYFKYIDYYNKMEGDRENTDVATEVSGVKINKEKIYLDPNKRSH